MFADLPDARSVRAHMEAIHDKTVSEYADTVISALMHLQRDDLEAQVVEVGYAWMASEQIFVPRGKYVPGDVDGQCTCVANPEDYKSGLKARLFSLGLNVTGFCTKNDNRGRAYNYIVKLENPFKGPRPSYTNSKFWATYDRELQADAERLAKEVYERVLGNRCTFVLKTRPTYHSNLVDVAAQLCLKRYVCEIHADHAESRMKISPAE